MASLVVMFVSYIICSRIVSCFLVALLMELPRRSLPSISFTVTSRQFLRHHLRFRHRICTSISAQPGFPVRFSRPLSHNHCRTNPVVGFAGFPDVDSILLVLRRRLVSKLIPLIPITFPRFRLLQISPLHAVSYIHLRRRAILLLLRLIRFRQHSVVVHRPKPSSRPNENVARSP